MRGELERDAAGDVALTPGAGRTPPWVWNGHGTPVLGIGERGSSPRVSFPGSCYVGE